MIRRVVAFPLSLTLLRLILGPVAILVAALPLNTNLFVPILITAFLSDYYDGVLARRLDVAYPWVRRLDSITDVLFYLCVLIAAWLMVKPTLIAAVVPIAVCLVGELICNAVSLIKFKALPATHSLLAKLYGLCLYVAFLCLLSFDAGPWVLWVLAGVSALANSEVIAIMLLSKRQPIDVLSIFHLRSRQAELASSENNATS